MFGGKAQTEEQKEELRQKKLKQMQLEKEKKEKQQAGKIIDVEKLAQLEEVFEVDETR